MKVAHCFTWVQSVRRIALLAGAVLLLCLSGCTHLFFQPSKVMVRTPQDIGVAYEPVRLQASDGVHTSNWFLPAAGTPKGTVLFLHGNAENISTHIGSVHWMPQAGYQVFLLDYRGYGQSEGVASVDGAQRDIDAAVRHLMARPDVDRGRLFLFGQSLGGALALHYVARGPQRGVFRAVIADSSFSGYRRIVREKLATSWLTGWVRWPASWLVTDDFSPERSVGAISPVPLLLMAGGRDAIVPPSHGERLFALAGAPKTYWLFPEAGHIGALQSREARQRLILFLNSVLSDSGPAR